MAYRQDLFLETIKQLRSGKTQDELSEYVNQLVQDCRATGKMGTITLQIKIKPDTGDTGQYFLEDKITVKKPAFERGKTLMFGTPEGNLQRTDPNQGELPLRDVSSEQQAPREVTQPDVPARSV
ncbi:hypothetical protein [Gilvimarinus agarilyticus]|uniref:hypothetical protein n=1 Tax=Gilvimarinus agarilyticus TaxID=679259 RepID=UPI00059EF004|nr:hypothetical protein [Gilvimarinus agarilyticus]